MDTVEMSLPMPEKSKGEKMWARVLSLDCGWEDYSRPSRSVSVGIQIPLEDFEPERLMFNEPESAA